MPLWFSASVAQQLSRALHGIPLLTANLVLAVVVREQQSVCDCRMFLLSTMLMFLSNGSEPA